MIFFLVNLPDFQDKQMQPQLISLEKAHKAANSTSMLQHVR